jgi:hypothetical protein
MRVRLPDNFSDHLFLLPDGSLVLPPDRTAVGWDNPEVEQDITLLECGPSQYVSTLFPGQCLYQWYGHAIAMLCQDGRVLQLTVPGCPGHLKHHRITCTADWFRAILSSNSILYPYNLLYFDRGTDEWFLWAPTQNVVEVTTQCEHCAADLF